MFNAIVPLRCWTVSRSIVSHVERICMNFSCSSSMIHTLHIQYGEQFHAVACHASQYTYIGKLTISNSCKACFKLLCANIFCAVSAITWKEREHIFNCILFKSTLFVQYSVLKDMNCILNLHRNVKEKPVQSSFTVNYFTVLEKDLQK
jgi:hypothetical protein